VVEPSLIEQIAQLSPEQAQRAALTVYDELPAEALAGDEKWPLEDLTVRATMLSASAPEDVRGAIDELLGPQDSPLKGELATAVLAQLAAAPATAPLVEEAVAAVRTPDMLPIPLIVGAVLIYLARIKTKEQSSTSVDPATGVTTTTTTVERQNLPALAELTGNFNDILAKLKGF
jgi:hypothetical protein